MGCPKTYRTLLVSPTCVVSSALSLSCIPWVTANYFSSAVTKLNNDLESCFESTIFLLQSYFCSKSQWVIFVIIISDHFGILNYISYTDLMQWQQVRQKLSKHIGNKPNWWAYSAFLDLNRESYKSACMFPRSWMIYRIHKSYFCWYTLSCCQRSNKLAVGRPTFRVKDEISINCFTIQLLLQCVLCLLLERRETFIQGISFSKHFPRNQNDWQVREKRKRQM